ncbi:unnamed protein product [Penicillium roqueforti FM164]|uniref:Genomic scaffold, ProqFM164S02 n=1 Tax=Penicillium roqueforti (strain FM164) TaxID=1365484 RepID=W6Q3J8_PENRF|nr:unnamed protein product [Penicillium roqueforti FM164]
MGYTYKSPISEQFVDCGEILFDLSDSQNKEVCLIQYHAENEWLLAKECHQETGYQAICRLPRPQLPVQPKDAAEMGQVF